ncbi:MAG: RecX family transcriptional regulator [Acidobacteria bacterium]|nr:RecX family transcriptional regulator [Acidobacteriota bacterium]
MTTEAYEKTMQRAFRLLSYKPRSKAELRARLLEKDWAEESIVDAVMARLEHLGYLDDEQLAAALVSSRLERRALGRSRVRRDLERRKLPSETVENALDQAFTEQSEEELIERAIAKRLRTKGPPATREESKKLFDYLVRRGFNIDLVIRKVREVGKETDEE